MTHPSVAARPTWTAGFTLIEFTLVVAISGILMVGLGAVIEIPRIMLEEREQNAASVSGADRFISVMDRDIRYCHDVRLINSHKLEVDTATGAMVTYEFSSVQGDPIVRSSDAEATTADVVPEAKRLVMRVDFVKKTIVSPAAAAISETPVESASFDTFDLSPGYTISSGGRVRGATLTATQQVKTMGISDLRRPAFSFGARGIAGDMASATSFRTTVRRYGTGDLIVRVFKGQTSLTDAVDQPIRTRQIALGRVPNAALPSSFANVVVPLVSRAKIENGNSIFVELSSSSPSDFAAEIRLVVLDTLDAVASSNGGFARSGNNGVSFTPYAAALPLGQSQFSFQTVQTEPVTDSLPPAVQEIDIPVSVNIRLEIETAAGDRRLEFTIPLQNKLLEL